MSRGCHWPPGQGSGKFVAACKAEGMPRADERASASRETWTGDISRALAASERMPMELWK